MIVAAHKLGLELNKMRLNTLENQPAKRWLLSLFITLAGFSLASCDDSEYSQQLASSSNNLGFNFDSDPLPLPQEPENNSATEEKFQLGRHLFYDRRLSGNETQSCESCHFQKLAFTDGLKTSVGSTGETLTRNAQTLTNVGYNASYTWANPVLHTIETQLVIPLFGEFPVELGINDGNKQLILNRFKQDGLYQDLFIQAFPNDAEPVTLPNIIKALAIFNRALISKDSDFDRQQLTASAERGQSLFNNERLECFHCHSGFNFSDSTTHDQTVFISRPFFNTGLYNLDETGSYPAIDNGLYQVTGLDADKGKFRPPTLRNIAFTAPYMHDGSIETLEEVVDFYAAGGRVISEGKFQGDGRLNPNKSEFVNGFELTEQERQDLLSFLNALSDENFINNPRLANPFSSLSEGENNEL